MQSRHLKIAMLVLTLVGLGVASYLTYAHYSGAEVPCPKGGGCETVQHSVYSKLAGVPVALIGLVGYVAIGTITVDQALFAVTLAPFMVAGLWASRHLHPFVDSGWFRPTVLMLCAIAGTAAILRAVL